MSHELPPPVECLKDISKDPEYAGIPAKMVGMDGGRFVCACAVEGCNLRGKIASKILVAQQVQGVTPHESLLSEMYGKEGDMCVKPQPLMTEETPVEVISQGATSAQEQLVLADNAIA